MPSPTDQNHRAAELGTDLGLDLTASAPEAAGEPSPVFLAAVRARRREVRTKRSAVAVIAIAVGLTVWQLLPATQTQQLPPDPTPIAGNPSAEPPQTASLASLRRVYAEPGEGPLALPELPARQATETDQPAMTLLDSRRLLLADGA